MEIHQKNLFILVLCSCTGMITVVSSAMQAQELPGLDSNIFNSTLNSSNKSVIKGQSFMLPGKNTIQNQAHYNHSVARNSYESPMGDLRDQQKSEGFLQLGSINPMAILRNMVSQKMEFMQRLRDLKYNFQTQETERRLAVANSNSSDMITRVIRSVIQRGVNKFQKHTAKLEMFVQLRKTQLQYFLDIPMVASFMRNGEHTSNKLQNKENSTRQSSSMS